MMMGSLVGAHCTEMPVCETVHFVTDGARANHVHDITDFVEKVCVYMYVRPLHAIIPVETAGHTLGRYTEWQMDT